MVIVRDAFFHIPPEEMRKAINSFRMANAAYLLTTFFLRGENARSVHFHGDFFPVDLLEEPYNFPLPEFAIFEASGSRKVLGLWSFEQLQDVQFLKEKREIWGTFGDAPADVAYASTG